MSEWSILVINFCLFRVSPFTLFLSVSDYPSHLPFFFFFVLDGFVSKQEDCQNFYINPAGIS